MQALAAAVETAVKSGAVDAARVYLAGRGDSASAVFYAISRIPDRWAAGVALGGDPQAAIDSERIFTANFSNTPVLWISSGPNDEAVAKKLRSEGLNLEWRAAGATTDAALFAWLAGHTRDEFPLSVLGFAGALLVKDAAQLALLRKHGPMTALQRVALPQEL